MAGPQAARAPVRMISAAAMANSNVNENIHSHTFRLRTSLMDFGLRSPQQARSRRTVERLLAATVAVVEAKGLAGVTIPEIAVAAGVSAGSVYRRFTDKDAL